MVSLQTKRLADFCFNNKEANCKLNIYINQSIDKNGFKRYRCESNKFWDTFNYVYSPFNKIIPGAEQEVRRLMSVLLQRESKYNHEIRRTREF